MLRLAANISTMFGEWTFLERISAAVGVGFGAVECQWPYDQEPGAVLKCLRDSDVPMVLINAPGGDVAGGEVGLASLPGREPEFRDSIDRAVSYVRQIDCRQVHVLAGIPDVTRDHEACRELFISNIRWAADRCRDHDIRVMIEAINRVDKPGYQLNGTNDAVSVLKGVDRPNTGLQFDVYHSHCAGENIVEKMLEYQNIITHIQISGYPGRHEPHTGEIHYGHVFAQISASSYDGWVGCEYVPETSTIEGLGWAAEFGIGVV